LHECRMEPRQRRLSGSAATTALRRMGAR